MKFGLWFDTKYDVNHVRDFPNKKKSFVSHDFKKTKTKLLHLKGNKASRSFEVSFFFCTMDGFFSSGRIMFKGNTWIRNPSLDTLLIT